MSRYKFILLFGALILAAILALFFTDFVEAFIIIPAAYVIWMLGVLYRIIPQQVYWIAVLIFLIYHFVVNFIMSDGYYIDQSKKTSPHRGQVETLARMIDNRNKGVYFKWTLAHLLGEVANYLLIAQDRRLEGRQLRGRDWKPPEKIEKYLEAGLNTTFADYPRSGYFAPAPKTPFDVEIESVVEFLESEMEIEDDHIA